jgi:hypothetical protein
MSRSMAGRSSSKSSGPTSTTNSSVRKLSCKHRRVGARSHPPPASDPFGPQDDRHEEPGLWRYIWLIPATIPLELR